MPKFVCDGMELEVGDNSDLLALKSLIETRDQKIAKLSNQDGQKFKFGESEKEYEDMASLYKDAMKYYDAMYSEYQDMKKKYEKMTAKSDALGAELAKTNNQDNIREQVIARRKLERVAQVHLDGFNIDTFDQLTDLEVKQQIVNQNGFDASKYTEDGLDAMIEVIVTQNKKRNDNYRKQESLFTEPTTTVTTRKDSADNEIYSWVEARVDAFENAWKKELK